MILVDSGKDRSRLSPSALLGMIQAALAPLLAAPLAVGMYPGSISASMRAFALVLTPSNC